MRMNLKLSAFERFAANRCPSWQRGKCVHGFPGTRFCIGSLDPARVFEIAPPQCCDETWPYEPKTTANTTPPQSTHQGEKP